MVRDIALWGHILIGSLLVILPILIRYKINQRSTIIKPLSYLTAFISWLELLPAGILYINFYPATKTLIQAGAYPWLHSIFMETKEHWGLFLPIIAMVATALVMTNKSEESKKWWGLLAVVSIFIAILGRVLKMGAVP